jgi:hypothetical protein
MRTIDLLAQSRFTTMASDHEWARGFWDEVRATAVPVDCTGVAAHLASLTDHERKRFKIKHLPSIMPPFDNTLFFWQSSQGWGNFDRLGLRGADEVMVFARTARVQERDGSDIPAAELLREITSSYDLPIRDTGETPPVGTARYVVNSMFTARRGAMITGPLAAITLMLRADGSPVLSEAGEIRPVGVSYEIDKMDEMGVFILVDMLKIPLNACALLHCQNVRLTEAGGYWPSRQMRNRAAAKGIPAPPRFYTLVIDPAKPRTPDVAAAGTSAERTERALHICRGHFATYSEDRKLFGKYTGTFWIPAHVRGTAEVGLVGKDYAVKGAAD